MQVRRLAAVAFGLSCLAAPAFASTLTINSINGIWQNTKPVVTGNGTSSIRWGVPAEVLDSGYDFVPAGSEITASADETFVLGTFSHLNFPVFGTFLQSADLLVSFNVDGLSDPITSVFSFAHLETVNGAANCPDGFANGVGVNASGCADRVTATLNEDQSEIFSIGGVNYVLDITGFLFNGKTLDQFWTEEDKKNSAQLVAQFSTNVPQVEPPVVPPVTPPVTPPAVPLPASALLLAGGLALLGWQRRRAA